MEGQSRRRDGGRFFVSVGGAPLVAASMKECWPKHVVISLMQEIILSVAGCGLCFVTVVCVCVCVGEGVPTSSEMRLLFRNMLCDA